MILPTLSVCMTINDRPKYVLDAVFRSLRLQDGLIDQIVICFDGAPHGIIGHVEEEAYSLMGEKIDVRMPKIDRPPGWLSPVRAWNRAFAEVTSELTYCISSEVIQAPGNILRAKELLAKQPAVVFGKCECSCGPDGREVNWDGPTPGNLLVDSAHPRPLGFIMAMPTWVLRATGGYDEEFMEGYWLDDDDFVYRIWQEGPAFIFDDGISGVHQHHERPVLDTPEGQAGIARNQAYMMQKYGCLRPMEREKILTERTVPGQTTWYRP
jgi:hypothetical protein